MEPQAANGESVLSAVLLGGLAASIFVGVRDEVARQVDEKIEARVAERVADADQGDG